MCNCVMCVSGWTMEERLPDVVTDGKPSEQIAALETMLSIANEWKHPENCVSKVFAIAFSHLKQLALNNIQQQCKINITRVLKLTQSIILTQAVGSEVRADAFNMLGAMARNNTNSVEIMTTFSETVVQVIREEKIGCRVKMLAFNMLRILAEEESNCSTLMGMVDLGIQAIREEAVGGNTRFFVIEMLTNMLSKKQNRDGVVKIFSALVDLVKQEKPGSREREKMLELLCDIVNNVWLEKGSVLEYFHLLLLMAMEESAHPSVKICVFRCLSELIQQRNITLHHQMNANQVLLNTLVEGCTNELANSWVMVYSARILSILGHGEERKIVEMIGETSLLLLVRLAQGISTREYVKIQLLTALARASDENSARMLELLPSTRQVLSQAPDLFWTNTVLFWNALGSKKSNLRELMLVFGDVLYNYRQMPRACYNDVYVFFRQLACEVTNQTQVVQALDANVLGDYHQSKEARWFVQMIASIEEEQQNKMLLLLGSHCTKNVTNGVQHTALPTDVYKVVGEFLFYDAGALSFMKGLEDEKYRTAGNVKKRARVEND